MAGDGRACGDDDAIVREHRIGNCGGDDLADVFDRDALVQPNAQRAARFDNERDAIVLHLTANGAR